ncbi:Dihydrofolate reductase [Dyadobacter sp. CECT 9623]|uniref:Dihydrofolate reductase n=2 Tax=Dyadobacter linearis TaxID=2823330 RepID=A0ABN7R9R1_9BACT|nr:Dihydrofolate reductase [Dyadobacter sp. CECT 9623]
MIMENKPTLANESNRQPQLYIIAAMSENRVIGNQNHLPWHLPDEWKNFKKITDGKPFLMGRTSFEAPDALHSSYRNVVLSSRAASEEKSDVAYVKDIPGALALLSEETEVFVLGGAAVFEQMLPLVQKLYLTIVHAELEGDAYFPVINQNEWELVTSDYHGIDDEHQYSFSMNVYERKMAD